MLRPLNGLVCVSVLLACAGCGPSREALLQMKDQHDSAKTLDNLVEVLENLEAVKDPPQPDQRRLMLEIGAFLAHRAEGYPPLGSKPENSPLELSRRMRLALQRELDKPRLPSEASLRQAGFDPGTSRSTLIAWAAWELGSWKSPEIFEKLSAALGRDDVVADPKALAAVLARLIERRPELAADPGLAGRTWDNVLHVHAALDAKADAALALQLDALDTALVDLPRLSQVLTRDGTEARLRLAAIREADRLLLTWIRSGSVPERHRAGLPGLAKALASLAVSAPDEPTRTAALETCLGELPWALVRAASALPEGAPATLRRCEALRVLVSLPAAAAAPAAAPGPGCDPASYEIPAELPALRDRLVGQMVAALPALPEAERWTALVHLAQLAPAQLGERLATAWAAPERAADWSPETWLAGIRLVGRQAGLPQGLDLTLAVAAGRLISGPVGNRDPNRAWDLVAEITAPWPAVKAEAFAAALAAEPPAPAHLSRLVRLTIAAAHAIPAAERGTSAAWQAAVVSLAGRCRQTDLEPLRPALRFLLDQAPDLLLGTLIERSSAPGNLSQPEPVLLVNEALEGRSLAADVRAKALDWLLTVSASDAAPDDLRLVAATKVLQHADAKDRSRRERVAKAFPILADLAGNP